MTVDSPLGPAPSPLEGHVNSWPCTHGKSCVVAMASRPSCLAATRAGRPPQLPSSNARRSGCCPERNRHWRWNFQSGRICLKSKKVTHRQTHVSNVSNVSMCQMCQMPQRPRNRSRGRRHTLSASLGATHGVTETASSNEGHQSPHHSACFCNHVDLIWGLHASIMSATLHSVSVDSGLPGNLTNGPHCVLCRLPAPLAPGTAVCGSLRLQQ